MRQPSQRQLSLRRSSLHRLRRSSLRRSSLDCLRRSSLHPSSLRVTLAAVLLAALAGCDSRPPAPPPAPPDTAPPAASSAPGSTPPGSTAPGAADPGDWPAYHRDNARTGVAPGFRPVSSLRQAWKVRLDGAVYGQPLLVGGTLLAATENDTVYALDPATGRKRWSTHLGTPQPKSGLPCGNIDPLGITGTMAYDPATRMLFALAESSGGRHTLFGLDVATGGVRLRRVAEPPKGDPIAHQERGALTVFQGRVYIPYGGLAGDCAHYIGSVVGIPTTGNAPLVSYAVPTTREAGNWASGGGSVYNGLLYFAVGNGESTSGRYDGSDSVLALTPQLKLADRFAPSTWADDNAADADLGSMSPAIVGSQVFIAGKRGTGYVLNAGHLGGIGGQRSQSQICRAFGGAAVAGDIVYVPCQDGTRAVRVDADGTAHVLWKAAVSANGSPVVGGGGVWVIDYENGPLYVLDQNTGKVRARINTGQLPHFASPTLAAGRAYLGTMDGVLAISPS
jgi:polyvinyl alcohol dehydrogenase (cytochrome)